jgi:heavy metal sensor kinase
MAGALALFGGLLWLTLRARLEAEFTEELAGSAERLETYFRHESANLSGNMLKVEMEEFCQGLPASTFVDLRGTNGFRFRYPALHATRDIDSVRREFTANGDRYSLDVGASLRPLHHTMELLEYTLYALIPAVVLLAGLGGAWLSRRALRPVDSITAAAREISIRNLSARLPAPGTGDEIERLTEVWNTMLARLEAAVGTLAQFAADASHELRTPLAVIRTTAELALRRDRSVEVYREALREIATEAERMTQLVEDLLFLAREDQGTSGIRFAPVDLRGIVVEAANQIRPLAPERGISLDLQLPDYDVLVPGSAPALSRLMLVLLDNAVKYSHEGGKVQVRLNGTAQTPVLEVEDHGIGIGPDDLPHIFRRFYRADKVRTSGGYGLGLSLAEAIAQAHGARIGVTSWEGQGSLFSVTFATNPAGA